MSPSLRFGGPGGSCRLPNFVRFCYALLSHCHNGTNYFTGEHGVRLDFISFHKKGTSDYQAIIDGQTETISRLSAQFPGFKRKPFFNDEGDPLKGWWKPRTWRGNVVYPSLVARAIVDTQKIIREMRNVTLNLLSNDNAFLNTSPGIFNQRTLLALFRSADKSTFTFVQKPIFNLMAILGLLSGARVHDETRERRKNLEVMATKSKDHVAILVVNTPHDVDDSSSPTEDIALSVFGLPRHYKPLYVIYKLSDMSTNPQQTWESMGSPTNPTLHQLQLLRHSAALKSSKAKKLLIPNLTLQLPCPGIQLAVICFPNEGPTQPSALRFYPLGLSKVLITWRYPENCACLVGFRLEFKARGGNEYKTLANPEETSVMKFYIREDDSFEDLSSGWYRVQAIDLWRRSGPQSTSYFYQSVHFSS